MLFEKVSSEKEEIAKQILASEKMPTDIEKENLDLYNLMYQGIVACIGGLKQYDNEGVICSVVVIDICRNMGLGRYTVSCLEATAKKRGISNLFLLTDRADGFFEKLGYQAQDKDSAPLYIKSSKGFESKKKSKVFMHKSI